MRLVLQRVTHATVSIDGETVGKIGPGLMILAGFGVGDPADMPTLPIWKKMLSKVVDLRIFQDENDKMNKSLRDVSGDLMLISQFTLYASTKKGRRPSFTSSCPPDIAEELYDTLVDDLTSMAPANVASGKFGAEMLIDFANHGPVTIILDSEDYAK